MNIINYAKSIVDSEIDSLKELKKFINKDFELVVNHILNSNGKIVICGIGKSADIGKKIVATLNSTGTCASFLHAADAIHGDLGILQKNDTVIIISKSGSSPEIINVIPCIKNLCNTIIAIVGNINSFLAKESKWVLNTTIKKEACYNDLAPTNSTTCQLVIGDALAMCLMKKRNFTKNDFAKYHPGGALGRKLLIKVNEIIKNSIAPKILELEPIKEVIINISKGRLGATAVVNKQNKIIGIITDGDIRRTLENNISLLDYKANQIMNKAPIIIEENTLASEALNIMNNKNINQLLVINKNKKYVGIIHLHDIIKFGIE